MFANIILNTVAASVVESGQVSQMLQRFHRSQGRWPTNGAELVASTAAGATGILERLSTLELTPLNDGRLEAVYVRSNVTTKVVMEKPSAPK